MTLRNKKTHREGATLVLQVVCAPGIFRWVNRQTKPLGLTTQRSHGIDYGLLLALGGKDLTMSLQLEYLVASSFLRLPIILTGSGPDQTLMSRIHQTRKAISN